MDLAFVEQKKQNVQRPRTLVCYICGREYGTRSLEIHIKTCTKKWDQEQSKLPKKKRKPCPEAPRGFANMIRMAQGKKPIQDEAMPQDEVAAYNQAYMAQKEVPVGGRGLNIGAAIQEYNNQAFKNWDENILEACPNCNRTFLPESLPRHLNACKADRPLKKPLVRGEQKQQQQRAKSQNVPQQAPAKKSIRSSGLHEFIKKQREDGTVQPIQNSQQTMNDFTLDSMYHQMVNPQAKVNKQKASAGEPEGSPKQEKIPQWKKKREEFISAVRMGKLQNMQDKLDKGMMDGQQFSHIQNEINELREKIPQHQSPGAADKIQCPHCERWFNDRASERHIPKCATIVNKPKPPPTKEEIQKRMERRRAAASPYKRGSKPTSVVPESLNKTFTMGEEPQLPQPKPARAQEPYDGDLVYEDDAGIIEQSLGLDQIMSDPIVPGFKVGAGQQPLNEAKQWANVRGSQQIPASSLKSMLEDKGNPHIRVDDMIKTIKAQRSPREAVRPGSSRKVLSKSPTFGSEPKSPSQPKQYVGVMERSAQFSNIQCPHCLRKFNQKAAERHIPLCQEKQEANQEHLSRSDLKSAKSFRDRMQSQRNSYNPTSGGNRVIPTNSSNYQNYSKAAPSSPLKKAGQSVMTPKPSGLKQPTNMEAKPPTMGYHQQQRLPPQTQAVRTSNKYANPYVKQTSLHNNQLNPFEQEELLPNNMPPPFKKPPAEYIDSFRNPGGVTQSYRQQKPAQQTQHTGRMALEVPGLPQTSQQTDGNLERMLEQIDQHHMQQSLRPGMNPFSSPIKADLVEDSLDEESKQSLRSEEKDTGKFNEPLYQQKEITKIEVQQPPRVAVGARPMTGGPPAEAAPQAPPPKVCKFCIECGTQFISDKQKFCGECGAKREAIM